VVLLGGCVQILRTAADVGSGLLGGESAEKEKGLGLRGAARVVPAGGDGIAGACLLGSEQAAGKTGKSGIRPLAVCVGHRVRVCVRSRVHGQQLATSEQLGERSVMRLALH
jgi:hypothetical protein